MHEPSLRVPGFLFDPRQPCGETTDRMVITTDFSVTMLAIAGIDIPDNMPGRDLTTLHTNPEAPWREDFYYDHPYAHDGKIPRTIGVRTATHTYTRYIDPNPPFEQLFDLRSDPDQLNNLAEQPDHAKLLEGLRHRCDVLREQSRHNAQALPRQ
jgi:arylsulfatase A-like enzyme